MQNILPDYAPRFYYDGDWFQMYDWVKATGGNLLTMEDRFYILFSNKGLNKNGRWDIYSISVSNFGKSLILNEMFEIESTNDSPSIVDIVSIYKSTPYLQDLNPDNVFFISDIQNYFKLTSRILSIIDGSAILQPIMYYL